MLQGLQQIGGVRTKHCSGMLNKAGGRILDPGNSLVASETASALAHTSNVPEPHAVTLVARGLHVSYKQLIALARSGVRGLEVWVAAYNMLRVPSDLPGYSQGILMGLIDNAPKVGAEGSLDYGKADE